MINRHLRVCSTCYDTPQEQLRAIVLSPDPPPVRDPRIEPYAVDEQNFYTLRGVVNGRSDMSAVFSGLGLALVAAVDGVSNVTAATTFGAKLTAAVDGASNVTAATTFGAKLTAAVDGASNVTAELTQVAGGVSISLTDTFLFNAASPFTETGAAIGGAAANRLIFVAISGIKFINAALTSVTIGGVSATVGSAVRSALNGGRGFSEIWWSLVPTGTTGNIVITATGDSFAGGVSVYRVIGADVVTPIDNNDTTAVTSGNVSTDVSIGANTVTISTATTGISVGAGNTSFANITENFEYSIDDGGGNFLNGGQASRQDVASVGAITLTASVSSAGVDDDKTMATVVIAA
jgi:hypothetical protein